MGPTCELFSLPSERAKSRNQVKLILTAYFTPLKDGRDGIVSTWNQHVTASEILGVVFLIWGFRAQHILRVPIGRPHVTHSAPTHAGGSSLDTAAEGGPWKTTRIGGDSPSPTTG